MIKIYKKKSIFEISVFRSLLATMYNICWDYSLLNYNLDRFPCVTKKLFWGIMLYAISTEHLHTQSAITCPKSINNIMSNWTLFILILFYFGFGQVISDIAVKLSYSSMLFFFLDFWINGVCNTITTCYYKIIFTDHDKRFVIYIFPWKIKCYISQNSLPMKFTLCDRCPINLNFHFTKFFSLQVCWKA